MKKIIICLFSLLLVLCITGCNKEIDKEKAKEELHSYIDGIEKPKYLIQEFCVINEYIETEIDNLGETVHTKDLKKIKKQLSKMVLTKKQGDELTEDSINILHSPIGNPDILGFSICLGIYNGAIFVFKQQTSPRYTLNQIYEFTFEYPNATYMYVYKNHTFYKFRETSHAEELINNNILTMDDIRTIYKTYQGFYREWYPSLAI